jgi:hypothetical protein
VKLWSTFSLDVAHAPHVNIRFTAMSAAVRVAMCEPFSGIRIRSFQE